jgi:hypothetical protein
MFSLETNHGLLKKNKTKKHSLGWSLNQLCIKLSLTVCHILDQKLQLDRSIKTSQPNLLPITPCTAIR